VYHLRGAVVIETPEMILKPTRSTITKLPATLRLAATFISNTSRAAKDWTAIAPNTTPNEETGKFYNVQVPRRRASSAAGSADHQDPFYFEAQWAND